MGTYPVTNRLFMQFIEDRGYEQDRFWEGNSRPLFLTQDGVYRRPRQMAVK